MSLEEECNWILSGREPVMQDGDDYSDDGDEDNTLDDISGDEVCVQCRAVGSSENLGGGKGSSYVVGIFTRMTAMKTIGLMTSQGMRCVYLLCRAVGRSENPGGRGVSSYVVGVICPCHG